MKADLKTAYVQAWNIGVQRLMMKNTVLEVRYVGNRASNVWHTYNLNEVNIFENGFLAGFKNAQQNLAINLANGLTGSPTTACPARCALPIFEAAFGARGSRRRCRPTRASPTAGSSPTCSKGEAGRLATSLAGNAELHLPHGRQHVLARARRAATTRPGRTR